MRRVHSGEHLTSGHLSGARRISKSFDLCQCQPEPHKTRPTQGGERERERERESHSESELDPGDRELVLHGPS